MKLSTFVKFLPLALVLGFTSCVAIDPAMLTVAGGHDRDGGRDYDRRPDYGRDRRPDYDRDRRPEYGHDHDRDHGGSSNYFGGPREWYKSGVGIGKRDRQEHRSPDYRRHTSQFDRKTEAQFAEGYRDGYAGRSR